MLIILYIPTSGIYVRKFLEIVTDPWPVSLCMSVK